MAERIDTEEAAQQPAPPPQMRPVFKILRTTSDVEMETELGTWITKGWQIVSFSVTGNRYVALLVQVQELRRREKGFSGGPRLVIPQ